jgi:GNAT superfamily N-acetyltransferase
VGQICRHDSYQRLTPWLDGRMSAVIVRRATAVDAEVLGIIGPAAYAEAYGYLWDRPDAYSNQLRTFGRRAFESLLARPEARVWIGETGGAVVGFLSMIVGSVDPVEHRRGGAEIPRIYIIGPAQRTGLGRLLLDAAIEQAAAEGLSHVWLDVMGISYGGEARLRQMGFPRDRRPPLRKACQGRPIRHDCSSERGLIGASTSRSGRRLRWQRGQAERSTPLPIISGANLPSFPEWRLPDLFTLHRVIRPQHDPSTTPIQRAVPNNLRPTGVSRR